MLRIKRVLSGKKFMFALIILYFIINAAFLTRFPFVHSDEPWLSGLSRNIMEERNYSVTETFFDLYIRNPHAIKVIFHSLQIIFLKIFGYHIFTFRLLSLIFGVLSLLYFYKLSRLIFDSKYMAFIPCLLLAIDVQFIYASHFARQEIIILFLLILGLYYFIKSFDSFTGNTGSFIKNIGSFIRNTDSFSKNAGSCTGNTDSFIKNRGSSTRNSDFFTGNTDSFIENTYSSIKNMGAFSYRYDLILGIIIGLGIGIHPNSFIISLPFIFMYIYHILITKKATFKNIIIYGFTLFLFALFFVSLSLHFDHNFFYNYAKFGDQFGVLDPINSKIAQLKYFYLKLYHRVSGTYYTPNVKFQFFLFPVVLIISLIKLLMTKSKIQREKFISIILAIIAINIGMVIVGRYNQTGVIFVFPLFYLLVAYITDSLRGKLKHISIFLLIIIILSITITNIYPFLNTSYSEYLKNISGVVNKNDIVLANLNYEYYFENGKLHDYRNLAFLKDNDIDFAQYIQKNKIEYIIYSEEMDFIYDSRPRWNGVYGNVGNYYNDMKDFLKTDCELIHEFTDKTYGIRIAQYVNQRDWNIKVYRVKK